MDFGNKDYGASQKMQHECSGAIPALEEEEMMGQDDDYEDLYDGVNVGESFSLYHQSEVPATSNMGNGGHEAQTYNIPEIRTDVGGSQNAMKPPETGSSNHIGGGPATDSGVRNGVSGNMGFQIPMGQNNSINVPNIIKANNPVVVQEMANNQVVGNSNVNMNHANVNDHIIRPQMENGPTMLFVGELHWWTTDVDLENILSQYGKVKEIKFFDERASGKSKGYCQVEFYDAIAASSCKEGMNGYMFNGRACVVTFASPQTLKQMGASYANKNPQDPQPLNQGRRNVTEEAGRGGRANFPVGDGGRGNGRGGWRPRGRGGFMGPRNSPGNAGGMGGGAMGNFSQGLGGPGFGGPGGGMVHPQAMMGPGFDPNYMGRGAAYGGFSGPGFSGMMPPFPAINQMGYNGMAPHVNPAFFNRGMAPNGMGMMGGAGSGMEAHHGGMWTDPGPGMGGWAGPAGEEHGQRTMESSYGGGGGGGDEGDASDYGYKEENPEKSARTYAAPREKERVSERERDYSGTSERRYRDDRKQDLDRSDRERKYREEKDNSYKDHRHKERDSGYEDDWDRGQSSSRTRSRSRAVVEDDHRSRSKNAEYGKRRRGPSE